MVEQLRYVGGLDEGLGGYCEALIIKIKGDGKEKYILHRYGEYLETVEWYEGGVLPTPKKEIVNGKHEKIEFKTKEELLKAFPGISLTEWEKTNRCCGYKIKKEEFQKAHESRYEREYKNR